MPSPLLLTVIVQLKVPFCATLPLTLSDLVTVKSGATTVVDALAVFPVPPLVEDTLPVVLFFKPSVEPVTVTLKVQVPLGAMLAPLKAIALVAAVVASVPPHCDAEESGTVNPAGSVSLNATPVSVVVVFGFVIVKLNVVVSPRLNDTAPKDLEIEGGATTVTVSEPVLLASLLSVMFPFGSTVAVLARLPAEVGVTANATLNDAPAGNVTAPFNATQSGSRY